MVLAVSITLWVLIAACVIMALAVVTGVGKYKNDPFWVRLVGLITCLWQIYVYLFIMGIV